ncbi:type II secretion system F family protein [Caulobacter endophyticus]|uniref:Type II secretion system protein GspF domain-containing protein n=1 Tax=Caulobacter endophyticus TaxID=2172652 RepID=A0A2T9JZ81_9CAUL|nr:type II secretion system F family protein [Caulobacter endophyticus]PVM88821.1 hypothetical protein DDF67_12640 [Caulobacter endophyticus]
MTRAWRYLALDAQGRRRRGVVEAETQAAALARLGRLRLTAVRLTAEKTGGGPRLSKRHFAEFLHDLGALVSAGVPVRGALGVLASGEKRSTPVSRAAKAIEDQLSAGQSLAEAIARLPRPSGASLAALVAAGEASGALGQALTHGADSQAEELDAMETLVGALSYPLFILLMTSATIMVILFFVAPSLEPLVQGNERLPLGLNVLLESSQALRSRGGLLAVSVAGVACALMVSWRLGWLRRPVEGWLLDGPTASISRGLAFGAAMTTFGGLVSAKVPVSDALKLSAAGASMRLVADRLLVAADAIRTGVAVSQAIAQCRGMPARLVRLASVGEETGRLGSMLARGGRLERQASLRRLKRAAQWLGPAMIVLLGALIGLIFAGLMTGVTSLGGGDGAV